jgi:hypothetical protein
MLYLILREALTQQALTRLATLSRKRERVFVLPLSHAQAGEGVGG